MMKFIGLLSLMVSLYAQAQTDPASPSVSPAVQAASAEVSSSEEDDSDIVSLENVPTTASLTHSRAWRSPDFSQQGQALGYDSQTFQVPPALEKNVKFWIDIYSKYTTDQGVIHDGERVDVVYEVMDFSHITQRVDISAARKEALRKKLIKSEKKRIADILLKLDKVQDPSGLNDEEKKIWDLWAHIDDSQKFKEAARKKRIRFQLGQRDRMIQAIFLSGRYIEEFENIFRQAALPIELTRIVFVESGFNVLARSKVGASGLWQIMPYTLRGSLKRDPSIDMRNHPFEAARAAARLFKMNYQILESWPLAVTAYNHGAAGILKLTKKAGTRDLGELVEMKNNKRKRFGVASKNFYACFLAVLEVERRAPEYFGTLVWSKPLEAADVRLERPLSYQQVLKWFDGNDLVAQVFNPQITSAAREKGRPLPPGATISVPKSKVEAALADLSRKK